MRPPKVGDGIEIVVAIQGGPARTFPNGVRTLVVQGLGVAKSRNTVIDAAAGKYLLFCDDDVDVNLPGVLSGVRHLQASGHAMVLGRGVDATGRLRKSYPSRVSRLTRFNSAKAATYEMLIDVAQVRSAGIRFDERFGAGAELHLADEYIFITDLLAAGLTGEAIPEVFGMHRGISSGERWGTDHDAHVRAVALNRVFGRAAPIARLLFALKQAPRLGNWRRVLSFMTDNGQPSPLPPVDNPSRKDQR
ncbi:MAG: glycosyltransferase family 2 protein [Thioalkalivibrio sp.]|nr:MAG: glycosyltransferase family 2 protein [Thioalkalivibrio sp.]